MLLLLKTTTYKTIYLYLPVSVGQAKIGYFQALDTVEAQNILKIRVGEKNVFPLTVADLSTPPVRHVTRSPLLDEGGHITLG